MQWVCACAMTCVEGGRQLPMCQPLPSSPQRTRETKARLKARRERGWIEHPDSLDKSIMAEWDMTRGWRFSWALMLSKDFLFLSNLVDQVSDSGDKSIDIRS